LISLFACCLLPFYFFLPVALSAAAVRGRFELVNPKIRDRNGRPDLSGIVFWLTPANGAASRSATRSRKMITQSDKRFAPHILVVESGSEVEFPNEDPFFHNVFSIFNGRRFDLGLYASGESRPVNFNRSGVSYIFCNIHPQMSAIVVTVDTPYYGISDESGKFLLNNVPEGQYRFNVWHERSKAENLAELMRSVQIASSGLDLGVIQVSEEGYLPRPHPNKFGQDYDKANDRSGYRRP
jgi:plastocyanin